ncbi:hypothetical protein ACHAXR_001767, partial [Thalassiosira sp. AJA248-18]
LDFLDDGRGGPEHKSSCRGRDVPGACRFIPNARASSDQPTVDHNQTRPDIPSLNLLNGRHELEHTEIEPGGGSLNEGKGTGEVSAPNSLRSIGLEIAGFDKSRQSVCDRTNNERFSACFGVGAKTLLAIFADLKRNNPKMKEVHFLLAMDTLKLYLTEKVMAGRWKCHEETYRHKWKTGVAAIAALRDQKIKFDPSDFPDDQIFLLSVDGVNFTMNEPRVHREQVPSQNLAVVPTTIKLGPGSHWYDHKSHSAGVSYEIGVDVRRPRICWINGPKPASVSESVTFNGGKKKDKQKDPNCLANKIPEGKRVLADSALKGSKKASTRMPGNSLATKQFKARAQARHETLYKKFKDFAILRQRFRHGFHQHKVVLDAVAVVVQYDMENGHPLFDV